jgi:phospholipid transport system substrate-binding protein
MTKNELGSNRRFGGKGVFWAPVLLALAVLIAAPDAARADRATDFMKRVARDLTAAARTRSAIPLERVINRYADVRGIGRFSLGRYVKSLRPNQRSIYQRGMVRFMARYAASQVPKYPIRDAKILGRSFPYRGQIGVDSRVTLRSGSTYDVRWVLIKYGKTFKVRDVEVFGFRMKELLRALFVDHIEDKTKGGSVRALVTVLSR